VLEEICIFYPRTFRAAQPYVATYIIFPATGLEYSDSRHRVASPLSLSGAFSIVGKVVRFVKLVITRHERLFNVIRIYMFDCL